MGGGNVSHLHAVCRRHCLLSLPIVLRLAVSLIGLVAVAIVAGLAATTLTPDNNSYARVSPASGFWLLLTAFLLLATDAVARLQPKPLLRVVMLGGALAVLASVLASGLWDDLSILKEYANRADIFWSEAIRHVELALGSLFAATLIGIPIGILCAKVDRLRPAVLNGLNIVQTIPSIALFGILIAPLGWIAANVPGASAMGIRGIGMAPAFVALFLYSLLPVVSNTVVGLAGVSQAVQEYTRAGLA